MLWQQQLRRKSLSGVIHINDPISAKLISLHAVANYAKVVKAFIEWGEEVRLYIRYTC